jgi:hypothetical protein
MSGETAFPDCRSSTDSGRPIVRRPGVRMLRGDRPERERHASVLVTDDLWELLMECWDPQPGLRPEMSVVIERLALLNC